MPINPIIIGHLTLSVNKFYIENWKRYIIWNIKIHLKRLIWREYILNLDESPNARLWYIWFSNSTRLGILCAVITFQKQNQIYIYIYIYKHNIYIYIYKNYHVVQYYFQITTKLSSIYKNYHVFTILFPDNNRVILFFEKYVFIFDNFIILIYNHYLG